MRIKLLDLFSGIGGFSLGLESTGHFETIAFVEKDEFCQKVLKKNLLMHLQRVSGISMLKNQQEQEDQTHQKF